MAFELFSRNGRLEAADGSRFSVKGINLFGFDAPDAVIQGLWATQLETLLDLLAQDKFNLLRIPIANDVISGMDSRQPSTINYSINPSLKGLSSAQVMDRLIQESGKRGILIVFDNQKLYGKDTIAPLWYDDKTSEAQVLANMRWMAGRFQQWNVVGYDILNEPHADSVTWGTRDTKSDFCAFACRAADALHQVNPRLLIFVNGLPHFNATDYFCWGGCLQHVAKCPVTPKKRDKIVYAPHVYPARISGKDSSEDDWQARFGYIKDMRGPAVVVGEHGARSTESDSWAWQVKFGNWLSRRQIDSLYWCLNPSGADTGGYLTDNDTWRCVDLAKRLFLQSVHPSPTMPVLPSLVKAAASPSPSSSTRTQLFSRDNHFWSADGNPFTIKGISWFGLETPDQSLQGLWSVSMESVLDAVQKAGFNFLRVPFSAQLVAVGLDTTKPTNLNPSCNPALKDASSGAQLNRLLDLCAQRGIGVMLDLHRLVNTQQQPLWYSDAFPEAKVIDLWKTVVSTYADKPSFLAVDLFNEPQNGSTWGGPAGTDWKSAAERIGAAVQSVAPHLLIGVQGIAQPGPDQTASWWGGNVRGNNSQPITLPQKDKLFFLPHVYGPSVYAQPYFTASDFPQNMPAIWDYQWGCVKGPAIAIGEWGGWGKGTDLTWQNAFVDYLIATDRRDSFHWCIGCSGDTGQIFESDFTTPVLWKLDLLKRLCPSPTPLPLTGGSATPAPKPTPTPPSVPAPKPAPIQTPSRSAQLVKMAINLSQTYVSGGDNQYQYEVTLTNISPAPIHNIYVVPGNDNVVQFWNCVRTVTLQDRKVLSFPDWCAENLLAPGTAITMGIVTTKGQSTFSIGKIVV